MDNMLRLSRHPGDTAPDVQFVAADIELRAAGVLWLRYYVEADPEVIKLPDPLDEPCRADELWKSTCFETFVRRTGDDAYCEYNFTTAPCWAAYGFGGYREGMSQLDIADPPEMHLEGSDSHFALEVELVLPSHLIGQPLEFGLSAIIEDKNGAKSHWALTHPPGKPDFHDDACFSLQLAAPNAG